VTACADVIAITHDVVLKFGCPFWWSSSYCIVDF